jgi:hypothetical protein
LIIAARKASISIEVRRRKKVMLDMKKLALLLSSITLIGSAVASPFNMKMIGHDVEIKKGADGEEQLLVDQKLQLKDQYIS